MRKFKLGLFITTKKTDYNKVQASFWIRIFQMIEVYEELGFEVSLNNYFKRYDAAIIFRKPKAKYYWILRYLKIISKKSYFDTCVNIFDIHEEVDEKKLKYAYKIARISDGVICASHQIARYAKPYSNSVFVMEDPVNLKHFNRIKETVNYDDPVFGWSGAGIKSEFLNPYSNYLDNRVVLITEEQVKSVKLDFRYEYVPWRYESFQEDVLKCDIAFLPRPVKDTYNSGHSSFKALVFAVSGIPIIANKIPSYVDMSFFYDGIVFLEDHEDDIDKCIETLRNRSLNTEKVRNFYSTYNQAALLMKYLKHN